MNEEAVRLIDDWCDRASTEIDGDFKWVDALEFILAEYESDKFMGLYLLPDGSQVFPMEVKVLRAYAADTLQAKFIEAQEPDDEPTRSAAERNKGLQ